MKVFIASGEKYIGKIQEDIYIRDMFREKGFISEILTMDTIVVEAAAGDLVILKSIWGYHIDYKKFLYQLSVLEKKSTRLINDYPFIYWNIDKSIYLPEINFLKIIPTQVINLSDCSSTQEIRNVLENTALETVDELFVIKPSISASGFLTFLYEKNSDNGGLFSTLLENKHVNFLLQPFMPQIVDGEMSIIVIHGKLLYGIKRFPGILSPDKNPEYFDIREIPDSLANDIKILLSFLEKKFSRMPHICRIDFVKNDSQYELMEIELIDPDLFFKYLPQDVLEKSLLELYSSI